MVESITQISPKKRLIALLLAIFTLVGHRIYVGKVGTSMLYFFTLGFFGIGWIMDIFMILIGSFTDKSGHFVKEWI
jgi:TM2 domain-containing membrane protein YozV